MSECTDVWKCKCGCASKQLHRLRWVLISKYKCNYSFKHKKTNWIDDDLNSESSLVRKLKIKRTNNNLEQFIPVKKVKFDEITQQIVVEIEEIQQSIQPIQSKQKKVKKNKNNLLISKDLIDLREFL